ncbi:MAG: PqqD family protein [Clostridia bacterium]|nr:PqqD family protein [Clostridia bacterium]
MKLKFEFVINEIADQKVAVAVGEGLTQFNGFLKMNDTGASIFEKLQNDISEEDLIAAMAKENPDETVDSVSECVKEFVGKLIDAGLVE